MGLVAVVLAAAGCDAEDPIDFPRAPELECNACERTFARDCVRASCCACAGARGQFEFAVSANATQTVMRCTDPNAPDVDLELSLPFACDWGHCAETVREIGVDDHSLIDWSAGLVLEVLGSSQDAALFLGDAPQESLVSATLTYEGGRVLELESFYVPPDDSPALVDACDPRVEVEVVATITTPEGRLDERIEDTMTFRRDGDDDVQLHLSAARTALGGTLDQSPFWQAFEAEAKHELGPWRFDLRASTTGSRAGSLTRELEDGTTAQAAQWPFPHAERPHAAR